MTNNEKIDTSNIFEGFEGERALKEEINSIEKEINKDYIYYIGIIGNVFKYVNFLLFILLIVIFSYIYIQKSYGDNFYQKAFLDPFCGVLLGDAKDFEENYCSGVSSILAKYKEKVSSKKEETMIKLVPLVKELNEINNFVNSQKVSFVINKNNTKINPIEILSKFDELKNKFLTIDKAQIRCSDIKIEANNIQANCSAYSSRWDSLIPGFNGDKLVNNTLQGTSISIASSFLNYIDMDKDFKLENKQKVFTADRIIGGGTYVYKTDFKINLYYTEVNLSL